MTTSITVDAHAGWAVKVEYVCGEQGQTTHTIYQEIVPAGEKRNFYIHSGMRIISIEEIQEINSTVKELSDIISELLKVCKANNRNQEQILDEFYALMLKTVGSDETEDLS